MNTNKTKIMVFRKGERLPNDLNFKYNNVIIEILSKFCYLGVIFTSGGSSFETQKRFRVKHCKRFLHKTNTCIIYLH